MSELTNQSELLKSQYSDATNLNARINLHLLYSTNDYDWFLWIFDHFDIPPAACILELGCGPAILWQKNAHRIPQGWDITLSDFSPGMVETAQKNLADVSRDFQFQQIDAQDVPFPDDNFDAVIANHMLYHVPDRQLALAEIRRVLKPEGRFYATTVGDEHMAELRELVKRHAGDVVHPWQKEHRPAFTLENGADQLSLWFADVTRLIHEDSLLVTEVEPLIAYIRSMSSAFDFGEEAYAAMAADVREDIDTKGFFRITKSSGLFVMEIA